MTNPIETKKFEEAVEIAVALIIKTRGFGESIEIVKQKILEEFPTLNNFDVVNEAAKRYKTIYEIHDTHRK